MAKYIDSNTGIQFNRVYIPTMYTSGIYSKAKYTVENNIISRIPSPFVNVLDIDWNDAFLPSLNVYIKTTADLLKQLDNIHLTVSNIDTLSKDYIDGLIENLASKDDIENIQQELLKKADKSSLPVFDRFATIAWVNTQLRNYSRSAYDVYVDNGGTLTVDEWLESLHGTNGTNGLSAFEIAKQYNPTLYNVTEAEWVLSLQGKNGQSAYEMAYINDPSIGTKEDWIRSLKGEKGDSGIDGKSAYDIYKENGGIIETEQEWLKSLKGEKGERGDKGEPGPSINILGYYETLNELIENTKDDINFIGDCYNVGGSFYVYNANYTSINDKWKFSGHIQGEEGKSAYDVAKQNGFEGTEQEWLTSLHGDKGDKGDRGEKGETGDKGERGRSAYDIAQQNGFVGTEQEWVQSLKGEQGPQGIQGEEGKEGESAYAIAKKLNPSIGTVSEWIESLQGEKGDTGKSAYEIYKDIQIALNKEYLDEDDWISSLSNEYHAGSGIEIKNNIISVIDKKISELWEQI